MTSASLPQQDPLHEHPRYQQVGLVGQGAFGFVSQVLDKETGEMVACKFLERGQQIQKYSTYVSREILNQMRLSHPHVVTLREVFLTESYMVLVLEFLGGGTLLRHVAKTKGLSEDEARWFFQQIIFAIDYCHRMGVASRDIKLENILLMDDHPRPLVKLCDFGFSKDENLHSAPGSVVGTPAYLPPEIISNQRGSSYDAKLADVWSCGVLLFVMVAGRYPFQRAEDAEMSPALQLQGMLQRALHMDLTFPLSRQLSDEVKNLITGMLCKDPGKRMTINDVLQHPWCQLHPRMVAFNDTLLEHSLANPPDKEVIVGISALVREAQQCGKEKLQAKAAKPGSEISELREPRVSLPSLEGLRLEDIVLPSE